MDKQKATQIITNVCAQFKGSLQDHQNIQMALKIILIVEKQKVPSKEELNKSVKKIENKKAPKN